MDSLDELLLFFLFAFLSPFVMLILKVGFHYWYFRLVKGATGFYKPLFRHTDSEQGLPLWKKPEFRTTRKSTQKDYLFIEFILPFFKAQKQAKSSKRAKVLSILIWVFTLLFYFLLIWAIQLFRVL